MSRVWRPAAPRLIRVGTATAVGAALVLIALGATRDGGCSASDVPSVVMGIAYIACVGANVVVTAAGLVVLARGLRGRSEVRGEWTVALLVPIAWVGLVVLVLAALAFCIESVG